MSLLSDEKALPDDDTVPDPELPLWLPDDEEGAKAVAADVALLDEPKRAARLLLLVSAESDDIGCLRENSLCSFRRSIP